MIWITNQEQAIVLVFVSIVHCFLCLVVFYPNAYVFETDKRFNYNSNMTTLPLIPSKNYHAAKVIYIYFMSESARSQSPAARTEPYCFAVRLSVVVVV